MARLPHRFVLLVLACLAFGWPGPAEAQVRKCITPDGKPLYTDQRCEALGASESAPERGPADAKPLGATGAQWYRGGCSRTLQDLVFEITTAIDAQDANRLSGVYHWVDVSDATASAVMDRLDTIVRRPLLDIAPVSASPPEDGTILPGPVDVPRTTVRRPPVGLRLEQTLANGITPARTTLALRRHFGCWWISL